MHCFQSFILSSLSIPVASICTMISNDRNNNNYNVELYRHRSFGSCWSGVMSSDDLAAAVDRRTSDHVQCYFCKEDFFDYGFGDNAMGEHWRYVPQCVFVRRESCHNAPLEVQLCIQRYYLSFYNNFIEKKIFFSEKESLMIICKRFVSVSNN